jgi:hypothetical protein
MRSWPRCGSRALPALAPGAQLLDRSWIDLNWRVLRFQLRSSSHLAPAGGTRGVKPLQSKRQLSCRQFSRKFRKSVSSIRSTPPFSWAEAEGCSRRQIERWSIGAAPAALCTVQDRTELLGASGETQQLCPDQDLGHDGCRRMPQSARVRVHPTARRVQLSAVAPPGLRRRDSKP